ncbi:MAG: PSD1 and planctomycete cytochrome C domain-containing protein, partial [Planctomycetaceae bacterium]
MTMRTSGCRLSGFVAYMGCAVLFLTGAVVQGDDAKLAFFQKDVLPILEQNCLKCHSGEHPKGELDLTTRAGLLKGGESGDAAATPGDVKSSSLIAAINWTSFEMPPTGKMSPQNIATLTRWIEQGAEMPEKLNYKAPQHLDPVINDETRNHWSFRPVQRPKVPTVSQTDWVRSPIDAFVLHRLEEKGLQHADRADGRTLYRRLHYDLLGLPPSPEAVQKFEAEFRSDPETAWTSAVDTLLESPQYGEHWARYWLDLVRYAETNSFERDNPKPFVWRYRDYVIRAFNSDKPFDQFIREQLAGDELPEVTNDSRIATGFYRLGLWDDEPADRELAFYDGLDDMSATTAQAFLGLTMNCARCHDHKLDPIPQRDYYRFLAFFRNVRHYGEGGEDPTHSSFVCSLASPEEAAAEVAEKEAWKGKLAELRKQLDDVEEKIRPQLKGGEIDDFKRDSERLRVIRRHVDELITREELKNYADTRKAWTELGQRPPKSQELALCVKEHHRVPEPTHILARGNPQGKGEIVTPGFPEILGSTEPIITATSTGDSSGRRLALAGWIASPDNPLTSRVAVNRIWQWHFGRGLVRSANNFGLQGDAPTHPELLDWLAAEFVSNGWSMKKLHREILLSSTYQMASVGDVTSLEKDPENNLFWRFDPRRLRAEEIRDSILAVNDSLDLTRMYGPSIYPTIPAAVLAGQSVPGKGWHTSSPEDQRRRSIYVHLKRSLQLPILAAFDVADTDSPCPVRFVTTQPTQALGMLNSEFLSREATIFAEKLREEHPDDREAQVARALQRATQRTPTSAEIQR